MVITMELPNTPYYRGPACTALVRYDARRFVHLRRRGGRARSLVHERIALVFEPCQAIHPEVPYLCSKRKGHLAHHAAHVIERRRGVLRLRSVRRWRDLPIARLLN